MINAFFQYEFMRMALITGILIALLSGILGSFVVAVPIAYYCGKITLDYFKDHTIIHWWLFPSGLLFVGGVILTTVVIQNWRTADKTPTESIRNE